jgi:diguanylate cyclase (GGDEF)-like protein
MMLDLDKFKSVNDTYGHLAGDAVLVEFASRVKSVLRSGDLLARYGGEEFAMLLTRTSMQDAVQIAERIRQLTAATPVSFEDKEISITVSIGICCNDGTQNIDPSELIARADEKLYLAKNMGRNQVQS